MNETEIELKQDSKRLLYTIPEEESENCKIVIASGKVEEGYCILGQDLEEGPQKGYYKLPGTELIIDDISANLFRYPKIRAFVAIPKEVIQGNQVYVLQPLHQKQYDKYMRGRLTSKEIERKFIPSPAADKGAYGRVEIYPTSDVVVKKSRNRQKTGEMTRDMIKEIGTYKLLSEISCLPEMYSYVPGKTFELQLERGTTISDVIEQFTIDFIRKLMFRLIKCLRAIASQGLIHADLKPDNLVLSPKGQILIIDWGLSQIDKIKDQMNLKTTRVQSIWWRSPEIFAGYDLDIYTHKIDIFSLGIILVELFVGRTPIFSNARDLYLQKKFLLTEFLGLSDNQLGISPVEMELKFNEIATTNESHADTIKKMLLNNIVFRKDRRERMPTDLADLISKMLEFYPKNRIDYDDILAHPFFKEIEEDIPELPIFINNMPNIPSINHIWTFGNFTPVRRMFAFGWVTEVGILRGLDHESLCLSWQLTDLYVKLKRDKLTVDKIYTYVSAALVLAVKINSPAILQISDMIKYSRNECKLEELAECELDMLKTLDGNIIIPTLYSYFSHYEGFVPLVRGDKLLYKKGAKIATSSTKVFFKAYMRDDIYAESFQKNWKALLMPEKEKEESCTIS